MSSCGSRLCHCPTDRPKNYVEDPDSPDAGCAVEAAAVFLWGISWRETNSIATISAASPTRRRVLMILVYPPDRSLNRPATSSNSLDTTALLRRKLRARRLAGRVPSLPSVIMRSVNPRISFAFAPVVSIRSCSNNEVTKFLNNALRCLVCLPSCRPFFLCRTVFLSARKRHSGFGLPLCGEDPSSIFVPNESPISVRISLISLRDFFPKFFVRSISPSDFCTRSAIVLIFAFLRQLAARTDNSNSFTLRREIPIHLSLRLLIADLTFSFASFLWIDKDIQMFT